MAPSEAFMLHVGGGVDLVRPTQGGSATATALRRAATCAGLLVLAALAAVAMNGGSSTAPSALAVGSWSSSAMGQAGAGSAIAKQELNAVEAASAAAEDASGVVSSEAPAAAPSAPAAPTAAADGDVEPSSAAEDAAEEPSAAAEEGEEGGEGGEGEEGGAAPEAQEEAASPEEDSTEEEGPAAAAAAQPNGPVEGATWQAPPGFPFAAKSGSTNMVEKPLSIPGGNTGEFPAGVVYNGPPIVGGTRIGPGGKLIVNMAGQPRSGTAMIERPQVNGLPQNVMSAISSAIAREPQPAPVMNEAPTDASPEASAPAQEEEAPEATQQVEEQEQGQGQPSEDEVRDLIARAFRPDEADARDLIRGALGRSVSPGVEGEQPGSTDLIMPAEQAMGGVWTYGPGATGPAHWGSLGYPTCSTGLRQSPVNVEEHIEKADLPTLAWKIPSEAGASGKVMFTGKTIAVSGFSAEFEYDGRTYKLDETLVHTPSEHTFGGQAYPMEIQFVHSTLVQGAPKYLIVSAFVRTHTQSNAVLAKLAAATTAQGFASSSVVSLEGLGFETVAMSILGQMEAVNPSVTNAQNYYQYEGSLTTPPCQQGTTWVLLKNALSITFDDLAKFTGVQGSNNRPVQPMGDRFMFDSHVAV